mmetsp:Transcript_25809/g.59022  ORF Transcript_25809/g.59022 Transcript_25809/m.59022 type:complete len:105 (+) Transcript_25809:69-383(+)
MQAVKIYSKYVQSAQGHDVPEASQLKMDVSLGKCQPPWLKWRHRSCNGILVILRGQTASRSARGEIAFLVNAEACCPLQLVMRVESGLIAFKHYVARRMGVSIC